MNRKRNYRLGTLIIIVLMAVSMLVLLGACGGDSNDRRLVGTWESGSDSFTFNRNGTGVERWPGNEVEIRWQTRVFDDRNQLRIGDPLPDGSIDWDRWENITIDGNELRFDGTWWTRR